VKRALLVLAVLAAVTTALAQGGGSYAQLLAITAATTGPLLARDGEDAARFRGSLVFLNYCVTCHGPNADGNGRAAKLYDPRPANLRRSDKNAQYMQLIVRMGGKRMGRSEFMPPWGEELTDEQIGDVVAYLQSINARNER
jgi:mono/diheme cytochrome c family protein